MVTIKSIGHQVWGMSTPLQGQAACWALDKWLFSKLNFRPLQWKDCNLRASWKNYRRHIRWELIYTGQNELACFDIEPYHMTLTFLNIFSAPTSKSSTTSASKTYMAPTWSTPSAAFSLTLSTSWSGPPWPPRSSSTPSMEFNRSMKWWTPTPKRESTSLILDVKCYGSNRSPRNGIICICSTQTDP